MAAFILLPFLMLLGGAGSGVDDVVGLIEAKDYFDNRKIDVKAEALIELAKADPKTGKASLQQLLAIRWLGENKVAKARDVLGQIAAGKLAQDPHGFAKEYAAAALARIDGKPVPLRELPKDSMKDSFSWFPDDVTFFAGLDLRGRSGLAGQPIDETRFRTAFGTLMGLGGGGFRQEFYKFAEEVGNLRVERISFGYTFDPQNKRKSKIFVRLTGKGDVKRFVTFMQGIAGGGERFEMKELKGPKGEPILTLTSGNRPPAMAFIGDSDVLFVGYDGPDAGSHVDLLNQCLDIRAGKGNSILKGVFAPTLGTIPGDACGLAMGEVPEELRRDFTRGESPFKAFPATVSAYLVAKKHYEFKFFGAMKDKDEAKAFVQGVEALKQMGLAALKMPPPFIKLKPEQVKQFTQFLESIKVEAKAAVS